MFYVGITVVGIKYKNKVGMTHANILLVNLYFRNSLLIQFDDFRLFFKYFKSCSSKNSYYPGIPCDKIKTLPRL